MKRVLGFCFTPIGGLIILYHLSHFAGLLANAWTYLSAGEGVPLYFLEDGAYLIVGIALFWAGLRMLNGEIGIVFIALGSIALMTSAIGVLTEFIGVFGITGIHTPFALGEVIANGLLLVCAIILTYSGIRSFSIVKDERLIDDEIKN